MLRSTQELTKYTIGATDGEIGHVTDCLFDDEAWVVRYLVVETGSWLMSRKVLISPYSVMEADWTHKRLPVRINKDQVKNSPDIDTEKPVSRQHEVAFSNYYGYPYYWGGNGFWGDDFYIPLTARSRDGFNSAGLSKAVEDPHAHNDPHLRSCNSVIGHDIHARDGDIGHVQDMLIDDDSWALRYMVVDTSNWWGGHKVLIAPNWIEAIRWEESKVSVNLHRQAVQDSPGFDSAAELNRQHELALFKHYQRPTYWDNEPARESAKNHDKLVSSDSIIGR